MKMVKMNLFYERLPSNIILVENIKLFFFWVGCEYILTYQIKKFVNICECIIKKVLCVYIYVCVRGCHDKYISIAT